MTFSVLFSRQLCLLLNAENIFHSMADILLREEDLKFASTMVHTLNTILLTSTELFQLRNQLKDLKTLVLPLTPVLGLWVHRHAAHSSTDPRRPKGGKLGVLPVPGGVHMLFSILAPPFTIPLETGLLVLGSLLSKVPSHSQN